jgi:hypothetical protein
MTSWNPDIFGFWKQHILHLTKFLHPFYQVNWKATSFVYGPEQGKTLQQVLASSALVHMHLHI